MEGKETYLYFAENLGANATGDAVVYPASGFRGIDPISATVSKISFQSTSGDDLDDDVQMTHASGKYKELCQAMATLMNSDKNDLVVVFDEDNLITHPLLLSLGVNPAAGLNITLDT